MGNSYQLRYIHDVWCNWFDGLSKSYHIPEYHEWRKDDPVQLFDQMPVLMVEKDFFSFVLHQCGTLPQELLELVHLKGYSRKDGKRVQVEHAFVITDGERVLAVNTEGENFPSIKSRLIPRHENLVIDMMTNTEPFKVEWVAEEEDEDDSLGGQILNLTEECMQGLTRAEREMKDIVMDCLFNIHCSDNQHEVFYWYVELFPEMYRNEEARNAEPDDLVQHMFDFLKDGWSEKHEEFGSTLVRYYDIFSELWKELMAEKKGIVKVGK